MVPREGNTPNGDRNSLDNVPLKRTRSLPGFLNVRTNESCGLAIPLPFPAHLPDFDRDPRPICDSVTPRATRKLSINGGPPAVVARSMATYGREAYEETSYEDELAAFSRVSLVHGGWRPPAAGAEGGQRGNEGRERPGEIGSGGRCLLDFEARGPLRPSKRGN
ncbi:hypothetical protein K0M31_010346, partial [Melipona bicolor]